MDEIQKNQQEEILKLINYRVELATTIQSEEDNLWEIQKKQNDIERECYEKTRWLKQEIIDLKVEIDKLKKEKENLIHDNEILKK